MVRIWREAPGLLIVTYLLLGAIGVGLALVGGRHLASFRNGELDALWIFVGGFLAWRVWLGGRNFRVVLVIWSGLAYTAAALTIARAWNLAAFGLLAVFAAQIALLLSPAVYQCTRRNVTPGAVTPTRRMVPPLWMYLLSLLAGMIVTLLYLANMKAVAVPSCGVPGASLARLPERCIGLGQGYPLRFLTADHNNPEIDKAALIRDWAQWSIVSFSGLYLLCRQFRLPSARPSNRPTGDGP